MNKTDIKTIRKIFLSLMGNEMVELNSYKVFPPDESGTVWITDPYGMDCAFFDLLSIESCTQIFSVCNSTPYHDVYFGIDINQP